MASPTFDELIKTAVENFCGTHHIPAGVRAMEEIEEAVKTNIISLVMNNFNFYDDIDEDTVREISSRFKD